MRIAGEPTTSAIYMQPNNGKLKGGERNKNSVLQARVTLFSCANSQGYVHPDHEGINKVTHCQVRGKEAKVFTPEEMKNMLNADKPEVQLALALTIFAGTRRAELGRLDWRDIRFDLGCT